MISFADAKQQVEDFLTMTQDARFMSEQCRDYVDGKQWTPEQIAILKERKQAPIVNNRMAVKLNGLVGLVISRKTDPKAYPRNQKDSGAAEAVTDGLRYVSDKTHFETRIRREVAENVFCEGYGGAIVSIEQTRNGEAEITIEEIPFDRIYFDPYSRKRDFSDARYIGYIMWLDEEDLKSKFPDVAPSSLVSQVQVQGDTMDDRPVWMAQTGNRKRYMVVTHYYKKDNDWFVCIFAGGDFLVEPDKSPFVNEDGDTVCPIELASAYIDRNNNRYGEISKFLDLQDEINHRRSKALFLLSQRQTFGNRGAVGDAQNVKKLKRELAKPDGHIELQMGELNKDFGILPTGDMAQGQFELLKEAKAEIDAQSYNAQLSGQRQSGDLSGIAIQKLQQSGINELHGLFQGLIDWELRIYKQIWYRIRQFWTQEKWVRVTDDQKSLRWVGFNTQITFGQMLQETMDNEALPAEMRLGASAALVAYEKEAPQALNQIVETRNEAAKLDMDIILDQSFDTVNTQAEQMQALLQFGAANQIDIVDLLDISNIQRKEDLIERIQKRRKEAMQAQQQQAQQAIEAQQQARGALSEQEKASQELRLVELQQKNEIEKDKIAYQNSMKKEELVTQSALKREELLFNYDLELKKHAMTLEAMPKDMPEEPKEETQPIIKLDGLENAAALIAGSIAQIANAPKTITMTTSQGKELKGEIIPQGGE